MTTATPRRHPVAGKKTQVGGWGPLAAGAARHGVAVASKMLVAARG
jgi:hypothetical protein